MAAIHIQMNCAIIKNFYAEFIYLPLKSESECKCLTCNQKPTGSQFSLLHEPNYRVNRKKTEKKTIEQSGVSKIYKSTK